MATIKVLSPEEQAQFDEWLASRPKVIQELVAQLPPTKLYRLKSSGHRVTIYSYNEGGTVTVTVTGKYNRIDFARQVFGIEPSDLVECELPAPDEELGEILTDRKDIDEHIQRTRQRLYN